VHFCGEKADSHEHAIPKWIGKRLGLRAVALHPVVAMRTKPRKQPVRFGSHRERILCSGCNAHFKFLEDEAIPVVEWMARGRAATLGAHEQDVLARWGAKTGYALIAADRDFGDLVPAEHTHQLREQGSVHPLTWVGYASWGGRALKLTADHSAETPRGGTVKVQAYGSILCFAKVALKVFGVVDPVPGHVLRFDTASLRQVFPALYRTVSWPLAPVAQDGNIEDMAMLPPLTPTTG
jgi:hypothetical protein